MYGFECFHRNGLEQLMINTLNEQMQYHYNQRIFVSEMLEMVSITFNGIIPPLCIRHSIWSRI